jgi:hypothetical protein
MEFVAGFAVGAGVLAFVWFRAAAICDATVRFFGLRDRDP